MDDLNILHETSFTKFLDMEHIKMSSHPMILESFVACPGGLRELLTIL